MERKILKSYVDMGFGFPVRMVKVPMVKVRGAWTPDVNYKELATEVLGKLAGLKSRLSGNQVKFIRLQMGMTMEEFAARLGVTHPAVAKWEKKGMEPTGMNWSTEKDLRLSISRNLSGSDSKGALAFAALYDELEREAGAKGDRVEVVGS